MGNRAPQALQHARRLTVSLIVGFSLYWLSEQMLLATSIRPLVTVAVWASPLTFFGWMAVAASMLGSSAILYRLWPLHPRD